MAGPLQSPWCSSTNVNATPVTNLQRRLKNLELLLTDPSGLVPHSRQWLAYWDKQMYLYLTDRGLPEAFDNGGFSNTGRPVPGRLPACGWLKADRVNDC